VRGDPLPDDGRYVILKAFQIVLSREVKIMSSTKEIISKALHLKPAEKSIIIEALLKSLDVPDPDIEKIWAEEAEKRLEAYKAGNLKSVSLDDLFATR